MSTIVERFLLPLFFVMSILYAFNSLCHEIVELKKIYHHATSDDSYLERGNVSFYFSSEPNMKKVDTIASDVNENKEASFFFPCVIQTDECEAMIQRINNYSGGYKIAVKKVMTPQEGIVITFFYDPKKIALNYEQFDSIGMQKGIVFRLYNKDLIGTLEQKNNQPVLRMMSNEKKPRIVIDVGHGGVDSGAIGNGTIYEKAVCLAIGQNIAEFLGERGCSVFLTRRNDETVLLDERTLYANQCHADLFVSIHANYASNSASQGVETFCLQQQLFKEKFTTLSAQEKKNVARYMHEKNNMSHELAVSIQNYVCGNSGKDDGLLHKPVDRKVKFSVSQVLLGTQMPAVLVEVGFLSHPEEVQLLNSAKYQKCIAQRIVDGIVTLLTV